MNWRQRLKGKIRQGQPLKKYTTFKIGGPAAFIIEPKDTSDLKLFLALRKKCRMPFKLIGNGSNILASDKGFKGAGLKLTSPYFRKMEFDKRVVKSGAGNPLSRIILAARARELSGLEFLSGIPGTIGGALAMNAGTSDKSIGSLVASVTVMDYNGRIKILSGKELDFGYRKSNLSKYIVLRCCLRLSRGEKKDIIDREKEYLFRRKRTQDLSHPSAGCVFKNPPGQSAGKLIDLCGLRGRKTGGAYVSEKHANFIINSGGASAVDVLQLMRLIKRRVSKKFGITLETEIKIWK